MQWLPQGGGLNTEALEVPIGTVIAFMGNTPPDNYLACDGNIYRIADYRPLANFINLQFGSFNYFGGDGVDTFAVPDLRGEFLRGTGTNSHLLSDGITPQCSGASVGIHQDSTEVPHIYAGNSGIYAYYNTAYASANTPVNADGYLSYGSSHAAYSTSHSSSVYGMVRYTARPTNTSVLYCIKYKNS